MDLDLIERPSPNFDERQLPVSMIVLHYTGMPDAEGALDRLTSPEAKVSCHYLIDEDGTKSHKSGLIGIEVESTGKLLTRNIWLKKL